MLFRSIIDKTYSVKTADCSTDVIDYFDIKENKCVVKINGTVKIFKDQSRYEFMGTILINDRKYRFDNSNTLVSTKVQVDGKDFFIGLNTMYSSENKGDEVTAYHPLVYHDKSYNFLRIDISSLSGKGTLIF